MGFTLISIFKVCHPVPDPGWDGRIYILSADVRIGIAILYRLLLLLFLQRVDAVVVLIPVPQVNRFIAVVPPLLTICQMLTLHIQSVPVVFLHLPSTDIFRVDDLRLDAVVVIFPKPANEPVRPG